MASHGSLWTTDELRMVRDLARTFFERECAPHEQRWAEQKHVDREIWSRAGELGLLCASIPEEYGGGGGDLRHDVVIAEQQLRALAPSLGQTLHSAIVAHYLNAYGTEEQKRNWLPRMATGELVGAIAMTEPGTGSDLQAVRTKAIRDGDDYVIDGGKTFISNGYHADLVLVVAKTDPGERAAGISLIAVETRELAGFRRGRLLDKIGQQGQDTAELFFDGVRVPAANLLGEAEGLGFMQLMQQLPRERLMLAVVAVATMERAVELTVEYTKQRTAFGSAIFDFQNTKFTLAECATIAAVGRSFLEDSVRQYLAGELTVGRAAMAKLWLSEQQCAVVDRCLQLFGGYGYMREYPIARLYVDSRVQRVYGGANEIMKDLIARSL